MESTKSLVFLLLIGTSAIIKAEDVAATPGQKSQEILPSTTGARERLFQDLFERYNKAINPDNCTVKFGLSLIDVDLDEEKDRMNTIGWIRMVWNDHRLTWNENETGISVLRIPPETVWIPDILLYSGPNPASDYSKTNVLVYPNGEVLWVPPVRLQSFCNLTLADNPYDEQTCKLKFGSWTFDGNTMGMELYNGVEKADTDDYMGQKYKVTKNVAVREEKYYPCCPEPYLSVQFTLALVRRSEKEMICSKNE